MYLFSQPSSLTEAWVRDNEYLHCIQTRQLETNDPAERTARPAVVSLTTAPEMENLAWVKIPHIHTFHIMTH